MKILYLVPRETYDRKMSRVRFDQMEAVGRKTPVRWWGPGWEGWDAERSGKENVLASGPNHQPDVVVTYEVDGLAGLPMPVVTQFNEADDHQKVDTFVFGNGISLVFFHHQNDVPHYQYWDRSGITRVHLPHAVNTRIFRDYGLVKDIDVLVAGNMNPYFYPFRHRLRGLAETVFTKRGWNVQVLKHPGYTLPPREGTFVREEFAKLLNRSKIVFTCSMRFNYALAKYSEIAACRALAAADIPAERKDFFKTTVLELDPAWTDETIVKAVEDVLRDPALLARRTQAAYGNTLDYCSMEAYADGFYYTTKAFLDGTL